MRRPLGLLAFGYGCLHFLIYLTDHGFSPSVLLADVVKRPFVTSGFAALVLLAPLALTSTNASVRR
ncbi:ferric reductase-like transmembrane domain-containing protein, partial [Deinococcus pimensis]|uniref:ferric reductase-like transmembrane domain-containing protein n=1 Tax=Deinococcus pimensis TaxID=309888 RepID=UPI00316AE4F9